MNMEKVGQGQLSICRSKCLGSGRFGKVFPGRFKDAVDVAVKRIEKELVQVDSNLLLTVNGHPNIRNYYDTDETDPEFIYLANELCLGTLEGLIGGKIKEFRIRKDISHLEIIREITQGVHHLHLLGVVHGNLKPSNVLISYPRGALKPMIKLTDFSLRRVVRDQITQFAFTEGWMSPFDARDPVSTSFDIFPLGCLFVFTVSNGTHPFGTDPVSAISNRQPMSLTLCQIESSILSAKLLDLIDQMLDYEVDKRPSTSQVLGNSIFIQEPAETRSEETPLIPCSLTSTSSQLPTIISPAPVLLEEQKTQSDKHLNDSPPEAEIGYRLRNRTHVVFNTVDDTSRSETNDNYSISGGQVPPVSSSSSDEELNSTDSQNEDDQWRPSTSTGRRGIKKQFRCNVCQKCYSSKQGMEYHMSSHSDAKPFHCSDCPKTFSYHNSLYIHRKTHLPPSFKCEFCQKMFTYKRSRDEHLNTHTGNQPFKCEQCHERFKSSSNLSIHRKKHHSAEPKFKCPICNKMFKTRVSLFLHKKSHLAPEYECPYCSQKFTQSGNCKTHWNGNQNGSIACKVRRSQLLEQQPK